MLAERRAHVVQPLFDHGGIAQLADRDVAAPVDDRRVLVARLRREDIGKLERAVHDQPRERLAIPAVQASREPHDLVPDHRIEATVEHEDPARNTPFLFLCARRHQRGSQRRQVLVCLKITPARMRDERPAEHGEKAAIQVDHVRADRLDAADLRRRGADGVHSLDHRRQIPRVRCSGAVRGHVGQREHPVRAARIVPNQRAMALVQLPDHGRGCRDTVAPDALDRRTVGRQHRIRRVRAGVELRLALQKGRARLRKVIVDIQPHDERRAHEDEQRDRRAAAI
ncbi:hypothetical protein LGN09_06420 [Burkholderia cenocepacia]|nr:hypothetical protein [Burkholderia cenocepacia]MCA8404517.1 hypothetical protein [Burkholderia cenocepacia]